MASTPEPSIEIPGFWGMVRATLDTARHHLRAVVLLTLPFAVVLELPSGVVREAFEGRPGQASLEETLLVGGLAVVVAGVAIAAALVVFSLTLGGLSLLGDATVVGSDVELGAVVARLGSRWWRIVATFLVAAAVPAIPAGAIIVGAGALGSDGPVGLVAIVGVSLGMYLGARFWLAVPVAVVEHTSVLGALRRAWRLSAGVFWEIFGLALVVTLLGSMMAALPQFVADISGDLWIVTATMGVLAVLVQAGLNGVGTGVLYTTLVLRTTPEA